LRITLSFVVPWLLMVGSLPRAPGIDHRILVADHVERKGQA
jgi:hypothetical protein